MEYQVTISETLSRKDLIEVSSAKKAEERVLQQYSESDVILDDTHIVSGNFAFESHYREVPFILEKPLFLYYKSPSHDFNLLHGDTFELLPQFDFKFDMILSKQRIRRLIASRVMNLS